MTFQFWCTLCQNEGQICLCTNAVFWCIFAYFWTPNTSFCPHFVKRFDMFFLRPSSPQLLACVVLEFRCKHGYSRGKSYSENLSNHTDQRSLLQVTTLVRSVLAIRSLCKEQLYIDMSLNIEFFAYQNNKIMKYLCIWGQYPQRTFLQNMICALFYAPIRRSLKALKRKKDRVFRSYIENISFIHIYNVKFAISLICT